MTDTIFARATAAGRAAVAIIRISGPLAAEALASLAGDVPEPRRAVVRRLRDGSREEIDQALVLWMPGPSSFTGEDCAELQVHGGRAVLEELIRALRERGLRQAEPGEFSRRALINGRMDLLQAEAIADLVDAETRSQKQQALAQMAGGVGRRYEVWRSQLLDALALIEAENDFPDEDLPGAIATQAAPLLASVAEGLEAGLASARRGRRVREGYRIALVGRPNAGKSSLFNALLARDAAIVSPTPGTTRDIVQADVTLGGYAVTLADTAGLREGADAIEAEGVRRAHAWAEGAARRLLLLDPLDVDATLGMEAVAREGDLVILTKSDRDAGAGGDRVRRWASERSLETLSVSTTTSAGVGDLSLRLEREVIDELASSEPPSATRERHQEALEHALFAINRAGTILAAAPDRAAEDVRAAARVLGGVVGHIDHEAVLDRVFRSFCIGK